MITCCKDCPDRRAEKGYNCHDHCIKYLAEKLAHEDLKAKIRREKILPYSDTPLKYPKAFDRYRSLKVFLKH